MRREHKGARIARARHHQRQDGNNGHKDHGTAGNRTHVERRILTQKERGGKQQDDDRQHIGTQAKAKVVETGDRGRHGRGRRRNHGNKRRDGQNGDNDARDITVGRGLDTSYNVILMY